MFKEACKFEKKSYYTPVAPFTGALYGAAVNPKGKRLQGATRGALKNSLISGSALAGGYSGVLGGKALGGLLGALLSEHQGQPLSPEYLDNVNAGTRHGSLAGALGGVGLGMYGGYRLGEKYLLPIIQDEEQSSNKDKKKQEKDK